MGRSASRPRSSRDQSQQIGTASGCAWPSPTGKWPDIPHEPWNESSELLPQWLQIVGKFRPAYVPWLEHSWHAGFARGLTSSLIHCINKSVTIDCVDPLSQPIKFAERTN